MYYLLKNVHHHIDSSTLLLLHVLSTSTEPEAPDAIFPVSEFTLPGKRDAQ